MKKLWLAGGIAAILLPRPALAVDAFYWLIEPPVVLASAPETALLTVRVPAPLPTAVTFEPATGTAPRPLTPLGADTWQIAIPPAELLFDYLPDDVNRNFVGRVRLVVPGSPDALHSIFVNVLDAQIPPVGVRTLAPDVRCSRHVVNVFLPDADPLGTDSSGEFLLQRQAVRRFYQLFPDGYDMINMVLSLPRRTGNRTHETVKNQVAGIGMSIFDSTAMYGSAGRLLGINRSPIDSFFDATEGGVHEMGHQWINSLDQPLLAAGVPHWPPSDMAHGVMGFSIPVTGAGGSFPYILVFQSPGLYLVQSAPVTREFSPLDLYLMGLLPPAAVPPFVVTTAPIGDIFPGAIVPGTVVTIADVIASDGVRVPPAAASLRLNVATVVITRQRPLTRGEMAFFDYFAARGESTVPLPFSSGFEKGIAKPFFVATQGRGAQDAAVACPLPRETPRPPPAPSATTAPR